MLSVVLFALFCVQHFSRVYSSTIVSMVDIPLVPWDPVLPIIVSLDDPYNLFHCSEQFINSSGLPIDYNNISTYQAYSISLANSLTLENGIDWSDDDEPGKTSFNFTLNLSTTYTDSVCQEYALSHQSAYQWYLYSGDKPFFTGCVTDVLEHSSIIPYFYMGPCQNFANPTLGASQCYGSNQNCYGKLDNVEFMGIVSGGKVYVVLTFDLGHTYAYTADLFSSWWTRIADNPTQFQEYTFSDDIQTTIYATAEIADTLTTSSVPTTTTSPDVSASATSRTNEYVYMGLFIGFAVLSVILFFMCIHARQSNNYRRI